MNKHEDKLRMPRELSRRLAITAAAVLLVATAALVKGKIFGDFIWHVGW